jgi:hypothetical protein
LTPILQRSGEHLETSLKTSGGAPSAVDQPVFSQIGPTSYRNATLPPEFDTCDLYLGSLAKTTIFRRRPGMLAPIKLRISTTDASTALSIACSEVKLAVGLLVQAERQEIEGDCQLVELRLGTDAVLSPSA